MGQQQLLLIVLSAIIVGIAIVVGINMFGTSAYQANQEAVLQDVVTIASRAQQWYRKPGVLGGGQRTFTGLTLQGIGIPDTTVNGNYQLSNINPGSFRITGTGVEGSPLQVVVDVFPDSVGTPAITP